MHLLCNDGAPFYRLCPGSPVLLFFFCPSPLAFLLSMKSKRRADTFFPIQGVTLDDGDRVGDQHIALLSTSRNLRRKTGFVTRRNIAHYSRVCCKNNLERSAGLATPTESLSRLSASRIACCRTVAQMGGRYLRGPKRYSSGHVGF